MKKLSAAKRKIFAHSILLPALFITSLTIKANDQSVSFDSSSIIGRWDITIHMPNKEAPSWLEVQRSGLRTLVGHFVGEGGSARPISKVNFSEGKISFSIPPQWEVGNDLSFEAALQGDSLAGTVVFPNGKSYNCSAVRAPSLKRETQPAWGKPIHLLNGKDLAGWHATGEKNQWKAEGGILKSEKSGSNIVTDATFNDFKLHIEFRYPKGSNSGIYLRGRYEVQIEDDSGSEPYRNVFSAIYGFLSPTEVTAKKPGEWNMYDITLVGRLVTVVSNGKTVICNQEIPGITGGALNSREDEPGPIYLQGDHGPIEYRNIMLTPAK